MEEKKIVITESGMRMRGNWDSKEIIAYLIEGLCNVWNDAAGNIDVTRAGKAIIDTLIEQEDKYKLDTLWGILCDCESEDEDDEDDNE